MFQQRFFFFCLNLTANTINPRLNGELPSSLVDRYPPLLHLWPFQSLLFDRFLFLQPKHYMLQDRGEWPKMKSTSWVENYPTKNRELLSSRRSRFTEVNRNWNWINLAHYACYSAVAVCHGGLQWTFPGRADSPRPSYWMAFCNENDREKCS